MSRSDALWQTDTTKSFNEKESLTLFSFLAADAIYKQTVPIARKTFFLILVLNAEERAGFEKKNTTHPGSLTR